MAAEPTAGEAPRRRGGRALNLLVALVSTTVLLGLVETVARGLGLRIPARFTVIGEATCFQRSDLLGIEFRPHCTGRLTGPKFSTSALGLRGPEIRDDGSLRVLAIGDSCTFGYKMTANETFPAQLQTLLDRRIGPGRYQVINAGVPGYTSHQGVAYLSQRGMLLEPAVVIIGFEFNDGRQTGDVEAQLARQRTLGPILRLDDTMSDYSILYRSIRIGWWNNAASDKPVAVSVQRFDENLREMIAMTRRTGGESIVIDWNIGGAYDPYSTAMARLTRELGVPLVVYDGPRLESDPVHPTPRGNLDLAARLMTVLEQHGPHRRAATE